MIKVSIARGDYMMEGHTEREYSMMVFDKLKEAGVPTVGEENLRALDFSKGALHTFENPLTQQVDYIWKSKEAT